MLSPVLVTPVAADPVTLEEAKRHCVVQTSDDDALLQGFIKAATNHFQKIVGMALVTQEWRQDFAGFAEEMRLPFRPVVWDSVAITYRDESDMETPLAGGYHVYTDAGGTYIRRASGETWPATYDRQDAVSVTFQAGVAAAEVSQDIKVAILLHVGFLYANRESHLPVEVTPTGGYEMLVWPYRRPRV